MVVNDEAAALAGFGIGRRIASTRPSPTRFYGSSARGPGDGFGDLVTRTIAPQALHQATQHEVAVDSRTISTKSMMTMPPMSRDAGAADGRSLAASRHGSPSPRAAGADELAGVEVDGHRLGVSMIRVPPEGTLRSMLLASCSSMRRVEDPPWPTTARRDRRAGLSQRIP